MDTSPHQVPGGVTLSPSLVSCMSLLSPWDPGVAPRATKQTGRTGGEHQGWPAPGAPAMAIDTGSTAGCWEPAGRAHPDAGITPRAFGWSRCWSLHPGRADLTEQVFLLCSLLLCTTSPQHLGGVRMPTGGAGGHVQDHRSTPHGCPFIPRLLPVSPGLWGCAWEVLPSPSLH